MFRTASIEDVLSVHTILMNIANLNFAYTFLFECWCPILNEEKVKVQGRSTKVKFEA